MEGPAYIAFPAVEFPLPLWIIFLPLGISVSGNNHVVWCWGLNLEPHSLQAGAPH